MTKWHQNAHFYHLYPLGFCKDGGKLIDFINWIPHLKRLNINAIYLGPIFESTNHGYDTKDYFKIDQRLGSIDDFKVLCQELHKNDIRIILDGVFHHTGRDFWAFQDLQKNLATSAYKDWYTGIDFNAKSPEGDLFNYAPWEGHYSLPKLNLLNTDVKRHLFDAITYWIEEFTIDGLRLDVAYALEMEFIKELRSHTRSIKKDFFLLGEVIHGDYNNWIGEDTLDSVTGYQIYKAIFSSHNDKNMFELEYELNRQFGESGVYKNHLLYNFLDNHDVNRIASTLEDPHWLHTALILLYTIPGMPSIYYGSEFGIQGERDEWSDDALRPSAFDIHESTKALSIEKTIKLLSGIRQQYKELQQGSFTSIYINSDVFIFERVIENRHCIVCINISQTPYDLTNHIDINAYYDILNNEDDSIIKSIPANWGRILIKKSRSE